RLRWETTPYRSDAKDRHPDLMRRLQSKIFPTAPVGYVYPGDPGVPAHFANTRWNDFGPRLGLAYSPNFSNGILRKLFGNSGKSSIRTGYGLYYTNIEGANTFNFAAAPYSLFYFSSAPPLFATPFITRASGINLTLVTRTSTPSSSHYAERVEGRSSYSAIPSAKRWIMVPGSGTRFLLIAILTSSKPSRSST